MIRIEDKKESVRYSEVWRSQMDLEGRMSNVGDIGRILSPLEHNFIGSTPGSKVLLSDLTKFKDPEVLNLTKIILTTPEALLPNSILEAYIKALGKEKAEKGFVSERIKGVRTYIDNAPYAKARRGLREVPRPNKEEFTFWDNVDMVNAMRGGMYLAVQPVLFTGIQNVSPLLTLPPADITSKRISPQWDIYLARGDVFTNINSSQIVTGKVLDNLQASESEFEIEKSTGGRSREFRLRQNII